MVSLNQVAHVAASHMYYWFLQRIVAGSQLKLYSWNLDCKFADNQPKINYTV